MPDFTAAQKLREVERELSFRHFVYPRQIKRGTLKSTEAQRRIQIMTAIAEDYRRALAAQPDLFNRSHAQ